MKIKIMKEIDVNPKDLIEGKVTSWGNSGGVLVPKKFIGKEVYVIIKNKVKR